LQFLVEKELNICRTLYYRAGVRLPKAPLLSGGGFMKTSMHSRKPVDNYFHMNPAHAIFSLLASFVLAVLLVLMLVSSAH